MRKLSEIFGNMALPKGVNPDKEIQAITSDSREAKPGAIFFAVRGETKDGHEFIPEVEKKFPALIVGEIPLTLKVPYLQVPDSRLALARAAANIHGNPSHSMLMVGVTGTSGKTTTTYLLESILTEAGRKVGVIGTVNFRHGTTILPSSHTTPGPVELQSVLARMRDAGCTAVVMEVSSHALKQHRTAGIAFDGMVFTNLSREHLDYHPDMEDYFRSKAILFKDYPSESAQTGKRPFAAINSDDEYGKRLLKEVASVKALRADGFDATDLHVSLSGIEGRVGGKKFHSPLIGHFNAFNIQGAVICAQGMGIPAEAIARGVEKLLKVPGRLEAVPNSKGIHVLVDYAHKPDALEKVLRTLRSEVRSPARLITVFGCGGDRDRTKRPVMGRISVEISDHVFVTSDNPRTEDPDAIIREILAGIQCESHPKANFTVEADRRGAIHAALRFARSGDVVVIAGKGHEDYQIIRAPEGGTRKIHFDDREVALEALS